MTTPTETFASALRDVLAPTSLKPTASQLAKLTAHFEAMVEANRHVNLTRITDPREAALKHYADSMAFLLWARERKALCRNLLDVGTGAGFPAVVLAVMRPDWTVTALEATRKKVAFLEETCGRIGTDNLAAVHAHSDHWRPETDSRFDAAVFRAVGSLSGCLRAGRRFLVRGGRIIVYKTATLPQPEWDEAQRSADRHGYAVEPPFPYSMADDRETLERSLCVFREDG